MGWDFCLAIYLQPWSEAGKWNNYNKGILLVGRDWRVSRTLLWPIDLFTLSGTCRMASGARPIPDICHGRAVGVRVNFFGRCKFLQILREKLAIYCVFC